MEHKGWVFAQEVKNGIRLRAAGMAQFRKSYPDSKIMLVGRDRIRWEDFLLF